MDLDTLVPYVLSSTSSLPLLQYTCGTQCSHPLRKSDFWSEFGHFGEMAPKWLRNSDTLTIGAIVIDYINALRVFQHKQHEYSPLTPSRTPNGPSYMSD